MIHITPNHGRIGRIAWENTNELSWGFAFWDRSWPNDPMIKVEKYIAYLERMLGSFAA